MTKFAIIETEPVPSWIHIRPRNRTVEERFWEKVDKRGPDECWPWLGAKGKLGYGGLTVGGRRNGHHVLAHRLSYSIAYGPIPKGLVVRHAVCANPSCCNPAHLAAGTYADNSADMVRDGHSTRGDKHFSRQNPIEWRNEKLKNVRLTEAQVIELRQRHSTGETLGSIAKDMGVGSSTIFAAATGRTWTDIGNVQPRRGRGRFTYTADFVRQVRSAHAAGRSRSEIAEEFGLTPKQASYLFGMHRWKNVLP